MSDGGIRDKFAGDALDLDRTVENVPLTDGIARARFVCKRHFWDADVDAIITKDIDPSQTASGQVTQSGASNDGNGTGLLVFHLLKEDTVLLSPGVRYVYDVRVWLISGSGFTVQVDDIILDRRVGVAIT
jgi:hypothetical protein